MIEESLVNIQRHSGSFYARIVLERTSSEVLLKISDQGRGIQGNGCGRSKGACATGGLGIQSMRERMRQVRGQLDIASGAGGTPVRAVAGRTAGES